MKKNKLMILAVATIAVQFGAMNNSFAKDELETLINKNQIVDNSSDLEVLINQKEANNTQDDLELLIVKNQKANDDIESIIDNYEKSKVNQNINNIRVLSINNGDVLVKPKM